MNNILLINYSLNIIYNVLRGQRIEGNIKNVVYKTIELRS